MENNLDKFFKDKLEHRKFERKPAYWEEASKLIEQEEKRKRRGFFIWWFLGALCLVMLGSFGYWYTMDVSTTESSMSSNTTKPKTEASTEEGPVALDKTSPEDISEKETNSNLASSGESLTEEARTTTEKQATIDRDLNNEQVAKEKQNNFSTKTTKSIISSTKSNIDEIQDKIATRENIETPNTPSTTNSTQSPQNGNLNQTNSPTIASKPEEKKTDLMEVEKPSRVFFLSAISSLLNEVETNTLALEEFKLITPVIDPKRVLPNYKWSFGLTAGTILYPYKDRTELVIGYMAGLSAKYRFNTQWSIGGDLLYQQQGGRFTALKETEETEYKFGKTTKTYRLLPESTHQLYVPIYLQFKNGRSTIEAGAALNYLIAVRGLRQEEQSLFPWERPSTGDLTSKLGDQKVWMVKDQFNTWNGSLILGYRYGITKDWSIWGRTNYRLGGIFKNTNADDAVQYTESNPVNIRIGTTFYLF